MGLFSRTELPPDPTASVVPELAKIAQKANLKAYRQGLGDGIAECLDQLEGRSEVQGPKVEPTDELRDWITFVRAGLDQARAEDS